MDHSGGVAYNGGGGCAGGTRNIWELLVASVPFSC